MGYKRADWHSGLTYRQTCESCQTVVEYMDDKLGFRPWYADGFVYCPTCKTPLRHNEKYAIDRPATPNVVDITPNASAAEASASASAGAQGRAAFCPQCGKPFSVEDNFCAGCGKKREP